MLKQKSNEEVFSHYNSELVLRLRSARDLGNTRNLLFKFRKYLGTNSPSPKLAKSLLAQYADHKPGHSIAMLKRLASLNIFTFPP
jgi:hypothetical protein